MNIGTDIGKRYNHAASNGPLSSRRLWHVPAAIILACVLGIAIGSEPKVALVILALVFAALAASSRLYTAVLVAALFLPFQRLLAIDLGPANLKISQVIFIIITAKILAAKLATGDDRFKIAPFTAPVFVFSIVNTASVIWSPERVFGLSLAMWGWFSVYLSHSILNIVITRERIEKLVLYMIYGGLIASVFGLYQFVAEYTGLPSFIRDSYSAHEGYIARVQSTALEPLHYAGFLLTVIPLCLTCYISKQRVISNRLLVISLILMPLNLALTVSRGGYLGLMVALLVIWRYMGRESVDPRRFRSVFKLAIVIGCICLVLLAALSLGSVVSDTFTKGGTSRAGSSMARMVGFAVAWNMFQSNPIQGAGIGSYGYYFYGTKDHITTFVNNVPLEVAAETGLIGLICLVWFGLSILNMLRLAIKRSRDPFECALSVGLFASALGLAIQYMTASPFYAEWTWFALGAGGALYNQVSVRAARSNFYVEHKESVPPNYE